MISGTKGQSLFILNPNIIIYCITPICNFSVKQRSRLVFEPASDVCLYILLILISQFLLLFPVLFSSIASYMFSVLTWAHRFSLWHKFL